MNPEPAAPAAHLTIDGKPVDVPKGTLLWEAAHSADIDIPIFCYHSKLGPVGVCRMCMVEVEGMPKLTTACTTGVTDGMVVYTRSPEVEKAQRGILEFLLINHPLDCPICDRGGECPLQDQTFMYGPGVSRFVERKRHFLKPIHLGPTIDLDRERCILCWRCVRFTSEIAEDNQLILTDRGSETFIDTYEGRPYVSNFSGNVIELCPVGALTSHKQRFTFRPWELIQHPSICPHCPLGCNIHIDVRDAQEVIRFRSRSNDAVDEGWLCDRGRFGYDFIGSPSRLKTPLIRHDGRLVPASWQAAYRFAAEGLQRVGAEKGATAVAGIAGGSLPNEDLFVFRRFVTEVLGSGSIDYWPRPGHGLGAEGVAALERLNARLTAVESIDRAALIITVATDPGEREPVLELRIRKALNKLGAKLIEIGVAETGLTGKDSAHLRCTGDQVAGMLRGLALSGGSGMDWTEFAAAKALLDTPGSVVVLYEDAMPGVPPENLSDALQALDHFVESLAARRGSGDRQGEVGIIPMLRTANEMAARDFGLMASSDGGGWEQPAVERLVSGQFAAAFLMGANPAKEWPALGDAFDKLDFLAVTELSMTETANHADVVFPAASFAERVGSFTNTSRRVQIFSAAVPAPGIARPDWQILVELSQRFDQALTYSGPEQILADIARRVPKYTGILPSSYLSIGPEGLSVSVGAIAASE